MARITLKKFVLMGATMLVAIGCRAVGFVRDIIAGDRKRSRRCGSSQHSTRSGSSFTS